MKKRLSLPVLAVVLAILLCGTGCASHFGALPARQEFSKPVAELTQQYSELTSYKPSCGRYLFTPIWDMPYADDLVAKWGKPDKSRISWWNLISFPLIHPMARWYWEIEGKTVDALIDRPVIYGYEPHVFTLEIREKQ